MVRRILFLLASAAMCLAAQSCSKKADEKSPVAGEKLLSTLRINVSTPASTRAISAYTTLKDYEQKVNYLQLLIYNSDGNLAAHLDAGDVTEGLEVSLPYGTMYVYAVANVFSIFDNYPTRSSFLNALITLDEESIDPDEGLRMMGSATVTVDSPSEVVNLTLSRFVARIALVKIMNEIPNAYGAVEFKRAFLANVVAQRNYGGTACPIIWFNQEGRADEPTRNASHIINGSAYKASAAYLTYASPTCSPIEFGDTENFGGNPLLFYAFANESDVEPSGFHSTFTAQKTALIVEILANGNTFYYPIVLDSLESNKAYTVGLSLSAPGASDPSTPVVKGSMAVNISVSSWEAGSVYDEII